MRGARSNAAERTEAELRYLADHDSLTGLLDRRRFRAELDQLRLLHRPLRRPGRGDDHRHRRPQGGQRHARPPRRRQPDPPASPAIMRERVRATDIVARLSGDEFAVLMPQTDTAGALQLGEDLRAEVAENARPAPEAEAATISVGITMFGGKRAAAPRRSWSPPTRRCTGPRQEGRNRIALFRDPSEPQRATQRRRQTTTRPDPRRAHPRPPQPRTPSRSAASPRAGSSATSCCCG